MTTAPSFSWYRHGESLKHAVEHCSWAQADVLAGVVLQQPPPTRARDIRRAYMAYRRLLRLATERGDSVAAARVAEIEDTLRDLARRTGLEPILGLSTQMFIYRLSERHDLAFELARAFVGDRFRVLGRGRGWSPRYLQTIAVTGPQSVAATLEAHAVIECVAIGVRAANDMAAGRGGHPDVGRVVEALSRLMPPVIGNPDLLKTEAAANAYWQLGCSALCENMPLSEAGRYQALARTCLMSTPLHAATFSPMRVVEADLAAREARQNGDMRLARAYESIIPIARDGAVRQMRDSGLAGTLRRYEALVPPLCPPLAG